MNDIDTKVLVVDDAPAVRRLVGAIIGLADHGWRVVADAGDGREGVERARRVQPDVVLLDISMPVLDGLEALPLMREVAPKAVIVVLSGLPASAACDSALRGGAAGYIEKDDLVTSLMPRLQGICARVQTPSAAETATTE